MGKLLLYSGIAAYAALVALAPARTQASNPLLAPELSVSSQEANVETCTATWTGLTAPVAQETWWGLATGGPQPEAYDGLSQGCLYDKDNPSNTPLVWPPPMEVELNGVAALITDFNPTTGEFMINTRVDEDGTTLEVAFSFDATNAPVPTPIPSASPVALALMAGLFALLVTWRLRQRSSSATRTQV